MDDLKSYTLPHRPFYPLNEAYSRHDNLLRKDLMKCKDGQWMCPIQAILILHVPLKSTSEPIYTATRLYINTYLFNQISTLRPAKKAYIIKMSTNPSTILPIVTWFFMMSEELKNTSPGPVRVTAVPLSYTFTTCLKASRDSLWHIIFSPAPSSFSIYMSASLIFYCYRSERIHNCPRWSLSLGPRDTISSYRGMCFVSKTLRGSILVVDCENFVFVHVHPSIQAGIECQYLPLVSFNPHVLQALLFVLQLA